MFARERLAEKIGLPEARIQVSTDFILSYAIVHKNEGPPDISAFGPIQCVRCRRREEGWCKICVLRIRPLFLFRITFFLVRDFFEGKEIMHACTICKCLSGNHILHSASFAIIIVLSSSHSILLLLHKEPRRNFDNRKKNRRIQFAFRKYPRPSLQSVEFFTT